MIFHANGMSNAWDISLSIIGNMFAKAESFSSARLAYSSILCRELRVRVSSSSSFLLPLLPLRLETSRCIEDCYYGIRMMTLGIALNLHSCHPRLMLAMGYQRGNSQCGCQGSWAESRG